MPVPLTKNDMYPPDLRAKRLNNKASFLISTGLYEESISLLTKALELTERNDSSNQSNNKIPCSCKCCSFEECLLTDQDSFMKMMNDHQKESKKSTTTTTNENEHFFEDDDKEIMEHHHQHHKYQKHSFSSSLSSQKVVLYSPRSKTTMAKEPKDGGFVYSRPLVINQHSIEECHYMGISLSLIILFNLSIAHHLLAITEIKKEKYDANMGETGRARAQHALQMYNLAYRGYVQQQQTYNNNNNNIINVDDDKYDENARSVASLKFTIIISNNTGEIHRILKDTIIYKKWLQHLLSLIMYLVENNLVVLDSNEMDGFYHNVSPIMMKKICAEAA